MSIEKWQLFSPAHNHDWPADKHFEAEKTLRKMSKNTNDEDYKITYDQLADWHHSIGNVKSSINEDKANKIAGAVGLAGLLALGGMAVKNHLENTDKATATAYKKAMNREAGKSPIGKSMDESYSEQLLKEFNFVKFIDSHRQGHSETDKAYMNRIKRDNKSFMSTMGQLAGLPAGFIAGEHVGQIEPIHRIVTDALPFTYHHAALHTLIPAAVALIGAHYGKKIGDKVAKHMNNSSARSRPGEDPELTLEQVAYDLLGVLSNGQLIEALNDLGSDPYIRDTIITELASRDSAAPLFEVAVGAEFAPSYQANAKHIKESIYRKRPTDIRSSIVFESLDIVEAKKKSSGFQLHPGHAVAAALAALAAAAGMEAHNQNKDQASFSQIHDEAPNLKPSPGRDIDDNRREYPIDESSTGIFGGFPKQPSSRVEIKVGQLLNRKRDRKNELDTKNEPDKNEHHNLKLPLLSPTNLMPE